ncbi:hypothetical protein TNCV_2843261 [Trichonephila clavipes]|nr:hypothetical protein TNCV_2843261 [Trichonephila clavipes]
MSEFERGRIIERKRHFGQIGESLVIWVEAMRPLEDAGKNGWKMAYFSVMMCLATNPTSNCVLTIIEDEPGEAQGSVPILLSLLHSTQALDQELLSETPFLLTAGPFWSLFEHTCSTAVRRRHPQNCLATVPLAAPWTHFLAR